MPGRCKKYKTLLALDGGGLKGIITTQILMAVSNQTKKYLLDDQGLLKDFNSTFHYDRITDFHIDLADYFDAVAGISAGSWIATYIASKGGARGPLRSSARVFNQAFIRQRYGYVRPGSLEGLEVFFLEYGARIYPMALPFPVGRLRFWPIPWRLPPALLPYMTVPAHPVQGLEYVLRQFLGDIKLSETSTSLLVVAFDLNTRSALQFVHDKLEADAYGLRRAYAARSLYIMTRGATILRNVFGELQGEGRNCSDKAMKLKDEIMKRTEKYLDISDVLNGTGRWEDPKPLKPFVPKTQLGQIRNFVWRRNFKEAKDYLTPGMDFSKNVDFYLRDIARASSAFPMLHEAKRMLPLGGRGTAHEVIDGAMVGNNPTMQAWIWMMRKFFIRAEDVATLSIGTGTVKQRLENLGRGGALQWAPSLTFILLDDSSEFQQSTLSALFQSAVEGQTKEDVDQTKNGQNLRIQVKGEASTEQGAVLQFADAPTSMNELRTIGRKAANDYKWNIKNFVERFIFGGCHSDAARQSDDILLKTEFQTLHESIRATYLEFLDMTTYTNYSTAQIMSNSIFRSVSDKASKNVLSLALREKFVGVTQTTLYAAPKMLTADSA